MRIEEAIETIHRQILSIPDDEFPPEEQWQAIEQAIATIGETVMAGKNDKYKKSTLTDFMLTARVTLGLAKAGGSAAIAGVMDDESRSMFNWLEEIMIS